MVPSLPAHIWSHISCQKVHMEKQVKTLANTQTVWGSHNPMDFLIEYWSHQQEQMQSKNCFNTSEPREEKWRWSMLGASERKW